VGEGGGEVLDHPLEVHLVEELEDGGGELVGVGDGLMWAVDYQQVASGGYPTI